MSFGKFWRRFRDGKNLPVKRPLTRLRLEELEVRRVLTAITATTGVTDPVTIAFNTPLNASTVNSSTIRLLNSASQQVSATVAYNSNTNTVTVTPNAALSYSSTYTLSIPGGSGGLLNSQGQDPLPANYSYSYTTQSGPLSTTAANPVVAENQLAGTPLSVWNIGAPINDTIDGYTTSISYNVGQTAQFKINTPSTNYVINIYRIGYYGNNGARLVASENVVLPTAQVQPDPELDPSTMLNDYGTWNVSASWNIPTTAVSGLYFADLIRKDGVNDDSMIPFVVRNDASHSDIAYLTSDETWEAYNEYGIGSLYAGNAGYSATYGSGYNYAVSYNRPFTDQEIPGGFGTYNSPLHAELPMIMWMEQNGYDVSYLSHPDLVQQPNLLLNHKIVMDCGHDEYWAAPEVAAIKAAQNAGVNTAFFSGNEMYWETRWAPSIDGSNTPNRTLICYKESFYFANNGSDVVPDPTTLPGGGGQWTGTWMDPAGAGNGGYLPANAVTGTLFIVNRGPNDLGGPLSVPYLNGQQLFWANTSVANLTLGQVATLGDYEVGYEWDVDADNGFRPAGLIDLSATTQDAPQVALDPAGIVFGPAQVTNSQTLFRTSSGALVFGAGTVQWSWGLSSVHDDGPSVVVPAIQQATVNLFSMMGVQPATLQPGLVPGPTAAQMNTTPPVSTIDADFGYPFVQTGATYEIDGTATAVGGGHVAGVEISLDGGKTWHPAEPDGQGGNSWSSWEYDWTPTTAGTFTIETRAVNDSVYMETPSDQLTIVVKDSNVTPPQIAGVTANVAGTQSAVISWITDKASTSLVKYGTSPQNLNLSVSDSTATTTHSLTLTGLTPNATYYYQVVSVDSHGDSATAPSTPASFVAPAFFNAGAGFTSGTLANTVSTESGIILPPVSDAEFSGTALPTGWTSTPYASGGSVTVANGEMTVNGALAQTTSNYAPGESLQFMANFGGQAYQIAGFAAGLNGGPYAIFNTGPSGDALYAETAINGQVTNTLLEGGNLLGTPHLFEIDWNANSINFWVDGTLLNTQPVTISTGMTLVASVSQVGSGSSVVTITTDDGSNTVALGPTLTVDWMRVAPYSGSGTYTSQVFDAGAQVTWNTLNYTSTVPANTSLTMYVRMGNTPTPDNTWTNFIPLANFGSKIGTFSRYFQYQAVLSTSDPNQTPSLSSVAITYQTGANTQPPVIVTESPGPGTTSTGFSPAIEVEFDDLMNLASITGSTFYLQAAGSSTHIPATLSYPGGSTAVLQPTVLLAANTSYTVTVLGTVTDAGGKALGSNATWTFTTPASSSLVDATTTDFGAGTTGSSTLIAPNGVTLAPSTLTAFSGTSLPSGWTVTPLGTGGAATLANGSLNVDGALVAPNTFYTPGQTLEFVATFTGDPFQHAGLGNDLGSAPWAIFSTSTGGALYARTNNGTSSVNTIIPGSWLNAPHLFRIDWTATGVTYSIDGNVVASSSIAITTNMRPVIDDNTVGGGTVTVNWIGLAPLVSSGTFLSRIFDATAPVTWNSLQWTSIVPSSTGLAMYVRMGNTPTPDSTWTSFIPVSASGGVLGGSTRYLQYEAVLTTSQSTQTPALESVTIQYTTAPNTTPPKIITTTPAAGASGVDPTQPISISFSELLNAATVNGSTVQLLPAGSSTPVPATVTLSGSTVSIQPTSLLLSNVQYTLVISGAIADTSGNALGNSVSLSFTTGLATLAIDSASAFAAGTTGSATYVSQANGGEVILAPAVAGDFSGATLPAGWTATSLGTGGVASVANGLLTVDGTLVATSQTFGPGTSIQFEATFSGDPAQHIGLGTDLNSAPWAIFSTGSGGALYARTNNGSSSVDTLLSGNWLNSPHLFEIDWTTSGFNYWIDGTKVASSSFAVTSPMRPLIDDNNPGGGVLQVSWDHVSPYATTGTYLSQVFDAGQQVTWSTASWTTSLPTGTSINMFVRMGNSAVPDSTWTSWVPVTTSGGTIGALSRYLQFRADLATANASTSPALLGVTIGYAVNAGTASPTVVNASPASGSLNVALGAPIVVSFSELMNASTITSTTFTLQQVGTNVNVPATVTYAGSTATLQPNAPLLPLTQYQVSLSSAITDASGNALAATSYTFATQPITVVDNSTADFSAGAAGSTFVSNVGGGEVILAPTIATTFSGSTLDSGWSSTPYASGGTAVEGGGALSVDGDAVTATSAYAAGRSLQFTATISGDAFQVIGFAANLQNGPWAIFTTSSGGALYTFTNNGTSTSLTQIPGNWLGSAHQYQIDWSATSVTYSIDGNVVATDNLAVGTAMSPVISDANVGGGNIVVTSAQMTPYAASGTFVSRVLDAAQQVNWIALSYSSVTPANTSLVISVRTGNTPTPDGTWTAFAPIANGGTISASSRYLQYEAVLASTDPSQTPVLEQLTATASAVGGGSGVGIAQNIAVTSGGGQSATVGSGFVNPLVVTVTDEYGNPVSGVAVNFSAPASGSTGTLTTTTVTTGSNGQAADTLIAGTVAGSYTVTASVNGISNTASFSFTNTAGAASSLVASSGFGQTAAVGGTFASPLVVLVTDQYGNPVFGASVSFAAPSSGATANLASASVTTGANGKASDAITANTVAGTYSVTASVAGVSSLASFSLTNTPGVASAINVTSGSGQSSTVGSAFGNPLVATVTDIYGNPVSGVSVTFSAPGSGASATLGSATVTTGSNGQASDTATAGTIAGSYSITASVAGVSTPATFSLTNTAGTASSISVVSGSGQSATVGVAFATPLVVAVTDQFGNALSGVTVSFGAPGSGASAVLASGTVTTGANGQASDAVTAGTVSGAYTVTATVAGVATPASFALTNTAGAASKLVFGQQPTNATAGIAISPAPTVKIADAFGNTVTGNNSTVTVTLSSGSFSNGSTTATATASNGVATFSSLVINTAGSYSLKATDGSLTTATSNSLTISAASANKLVFGQQPTNATAGVTISPAVTVKVQDAFGNVVTANSSTVTLTLSSGTFSNGSTTATATASSGVATFSSLVINLAGTYTLAATDSSLTSATSNSLTISAASARKLAFGQQPTNATSGTAISPAVTVKVEDNFGNVVPGNTSSVTLTLSSGTFSNGFRTATATASNGVATFSNLIINAVGTYTLAATDGTLTNTTSSSFSITPAPTKLGFGQQPTNATAGTTISPAVTVRVLDANGNVVTGNTSTVTLTLSSGTFSNGSTTATATASSGIATFSGLVINSAGTYTLTATDGSLTSATSNNFTIGAAAASKVVFSQQPTNATAGVAISPAVTVKVEDAFGNVVTGNNSTVTVTLSSGTFSNGSRTATVNASNGTATFSNLVINTAGTYTLAATDGSLTGATSNSLTISAAAASKLVFGQQPTNTRHGSTMSPAVTVFVEDAFGNICTTNNSTVTLTLSSNTFSTGSRTVTVSAVNGVATFNSLIINAIASNYTLTATDGALTNARSNTFSIT